MFLRVPEAHSRSVLKALSWRIVGSVDTFVISWLVTGKLTFAVSIMTVETFTKIAIYYLHEQFWARVPRWEAQEAKVLRGDAAKLEPEPVPVRSR
jgi:uncharacterized membrane protein